MLVLSNKELFFNEQNELDVRHIITFGPLSLHKDKIEFGFIYGNDNQIIKLFFNENMVNEYNTMPDSTKKISKLQETSIDAISNEYNCHAIWCCIETIAKDGNNTSMSLKYRLLIKDTNNSIAQTIEFANFDSNYQYIHFMLDKTSKCLDIVRSSTQEFMHPAWYNGLYKNKKIIDCKNKWYVEGLNQCYYRIVTYKLHNLMDTSKYVIGLGGDKTDLIDKNIKSIINYCDIREHYIGSYFLNKEEWRDNVSEQMDFEVLSWNHSQSSYKYFINCDNVEWGVNN